MAGLLILALVLTRGLGRTGHDVSKDDAVKIARARVDFKPDGYNIRFIRRGIPPRPFWVVSFWIRRATGGYSRITVVLVDANTGRVTEVRRSA
jgi:peptidase YpeB-like protein